MQDINKKASLEALLFASGEPLRPAGLKELTGLAEQEIADLFEELRAEYGERSGGLLISEVGGGYMMHTNPDYSIWAKKQKGQQAARLSPASLESLAIVAYRQPVTKAELEELRGVSSADGILKALLDRRLIKVVGRKEAPGKPLLYGTTREFLLHFGLKDLTELPSLKELEREGAG